jgi:hypothetical protein
MSDQKDGVIFVDLAFDRDVHVEVNLRTEGGKVIIEDYKIIERELNVRKKP